MNETNELLRQIRDLLFLREVRELYPDSAESMDDIRKRKTESGEIVTELSTEAATRITLGELQKVRLAFDTLIRPDSDTA